MCRHTMTEHYVRIYIYIYINIENIFSFENRKHKEIFLTDILIDHLIEILT